MSAKEGVPLQKYIDRNSGVDALEREIQQLKTALEVSESENKRLKGVCKKAYFHGYNICKKESPALGSLPCWNRFKMAYEELESK